jgi:hypothetical protein
MTIKARILTALWTTAVFTVLPAEAPRTSVRGSSTNALNAGTNAPAAGTNAPEGSKKDEAKPSFGTIPDAAHKPVLTTNSVSIAGQTVNYVAEAGMLPLL